MITFKIQNQNSQEIIMNKQKIKSNAKKTAQYTLVAPFVGVSSALYATVVGMW